MSTTGPVKKSKARAPIARKVRTTRPEDRVPAEPLLARPPCPPPPCPAPAPAPEDEAFFDDDDDLLPPTYLFRADVIVRLPAVRNTEMTEVMTTIVSADPDVHEALTYLRDVVRERVTQLCAELDVDPATLDVAVRNLQA